MSGFFFSFRSLVSPIPLLIYGSLGLDYCNSFYAAILKGLIKGAPGLRERCAHPARTVMSVIQITLRIDYICMLHTTEHQILNVLIGLQMSF